MRLFLNNVSTRPSCSDCAFNNKHSLADLTIADYWGVNKHFPLFDDDKGVTLVLVNTEKGAGLFADSKASWNASKQTLSAAPNTTPLCPKK